MPPRSCQSVVSPSPAFTQHNLYDYTGWNSAFSGFFLSTAGNHEITIPLTIVMARYIYPKPYKTASDGTAKLEQNRHEPTYESHSLATHKICV